MDLGVPLSPQWPFVQFYNRSRVTWFARQQTPLRQWLSDSSAKSSGGMYHAFPTPSDRAAADESPLPTRLLDLSPDTLLGLSSGGRFPFNLDLRLVTPEEGSTGNYMTLSHRWGSAHLLQLTTDSLDCFSKKIPFCSLPQTYQDAVVVVRTLGFRYLWIDALCILQDDPTDWLRESKKMAAVYNNSCCTIAAHTSSNDNGGILQQARRRHFGEPKLTNFTEEVSNSPLSARGWVFQERILSRRLLHFTQRNIFMEDASGVKVVNGYIAVPDIYNPWIDNKYNLEDGQANASQWCTVVEKFTNCELTYDTDRLPAIEGLSRLYGDLTKENDYVWGLWSSKFHQELLWTLTSERPRHLISEHHLMGKPPSWSWGSWSGAVRFPTHVATCVPACTIMSNDANPPLVHESEVDGTIRCIWLKAVAVEYKDVTITRSDKPYGASSFGEAIKITYKLDLPWFAWLCLDGEQDSEVHYNKIIVALISNSEEKEVFMAKVSTTRRMYYYLVLCEESGGVDRYRRVGIGATWSKSAWQNIESKIICLV